MSYVLNSYLLTYLPKYVNSSTLKSASHTEVICSKNAFKAVDRLSVRYPRRTCIVNENVQFLLLCSQTQLVRHGMKLEKTKL